MIDDLVNQALGRKASVTIPGKSKGTITSANRLGPSVEVFDPSLDMAKKSTEPAMGVVEGLAMTLKMFDEADKLIPAQEKGIDATMKGVSRAVGATDFGRVIGVGDEQARAYNNFRDTFGTLLARAFGEKGVVTNQDVARVMSAFPKGGDTIENRKIQREFMTKLLVDKIKRYNKLVGNIGNQNASQLELSPSRDVRIEGPSNG